MFVFIPLTPIITIHGAIFQIDLLTRLLLYTQKQCTDALYSVLLRLLSGHAGLSSAVSRRTDLSNNDHVTVKYEELYVLITKIRHYMMQFYDTSCFCEITDLTH